MNKVFPDNGYYAVMKHDYIDLGLLPNTYPYYRLCKKNRCYTNIILVNFIVHKNVYINRENGTKHNIKF